MKSLEEFVVKHYGKIGSSTRDKFEKGYHVFKLRPILREARLEKGMTQRELADKCGTNKS